MAFLLIQKILIEKLSLNKEPANTGRLIINKTDVKNIDQQYRGKNRKELIKNQPKC